MTRFAGPSPAFTRENRTFLRSNVGISPEEMVAWEEDFLGNATVPERFTTVEVALNTAIAVVDGVGPGVMRLLFDADANAEDAVLYHGDIRGFDVSKALLFECRAACHVVPTLTSQIVFGMCGDHNLDKDAATESAWFKLDGSAVLLCESDDTTTNVDDEDADSTTLVADAMHVFQIDFRTLADVKFYVDGANVGTGATFDMSALTAAESFMQPYFSIDKGADAGLGSLDIDYVKIWQTRT